MKHARKLASLLLALVMVFALATTAFAAGETGSITIKDAIVGQTYTIYQILDLESYNAATNAYSYKATTAWKTFINSDAIKGVYVDVDTQGYVTWHKNLTCDSAEANHAHSDTCYTGADAAAFAKAAQKYAKDNSITDQGSVTATTTTVSFTELDLGYYLVDSSLGTLCSLDTTKPNVEMFEKNEAPVPDKTVEEDSTNTYGKTNDGDIGQTVNYKATITVEAGAENYIYHDQMSNGLDYKGVSKVTLIKQGETTETEVATTNYTVTANVTHNAGTDTAYTDTFDVTFHNDYLETLTPGDVLTIYYSATINKNAVIGGDGNRNDGSLEYGDDGKTTHTPPSTTITYTWSFNVLKYANGNESVVLENAKFVLLNNDKSKVATIVNGKLTGWVAVPTPEEGKEITWPTDTVLTTDANGSIIISGLDADTYYLRETKAPDGYNKLANDVTVTITPTKSTDGTTLTLTPVTAKVNNQSGTTLPSTGGIGTTIFYVLGSILVIGAVVLLVTKKRMSTND